MPSLLDRLLAAGHRIAPDQALVVARLEAALADATPSVMATAVASALASSEEEYDAWRTRVIAVISPPPEVPPPPPPPTSPTVVRFRWAQVLLLLLLGAVGLGVAKTLTRPADTDGDGAPDAVDCAPEDPRVAPGKAEVCDGAHADEDCDGHPDEVLRPAVDEDGDGYGAVERREDVCTPSTLGASLDCDGLDPSVNPGAPDDTVDGIDQNCDGVDGPLPVDCPAPPALATRPDPRLPRSLGAVGGFLSAMLFVAGVRLAGARRVALADALDQREGAQRYRWSLRPIAGRPPRRRLPPAGAASPRLDVRATVRETARAGHPQLRWEVEPPVRFLRVLVEDDPAMAPWQARAEAVIRGIARGGVRVERWTYSRRGIARASTGRRATVATLARQPGTVIVGLGTLTPSADPGPGAVWLVPVDDREWWGPAAQQARAFPMDAAGVRAALAAARRKGPAKVRPPRRRWNRTDQLRATWLATLMPGARPVEVLALLAELDPSLPAEAILAFRPLPRGEAPLREARERARFLLQAAGDPLLAREREVGDRVLEVLRRSEPGRASAAWLRWRRDEILARLGAGGDAATDEDLRTLADSPLRVELRDGLDALAEPVSPKVDRLRRRLAREERGIPRATVVAVAGALLLAGATGGEVVARRAPDRPVGVLSIGVEGDRLVVSGSGADRAGLQVHGDQGWVASALPDGGGTERSVSLASIAPGSCVYAEAADVLARSDVLRLPGERHDGTVTLVLDPPSAAATALLVRPDGARAVPLQAGVVARVTAGDWLFSLTTPGLRAVDAPASLAVGENEHRDLKVRVEKEDRPTGTLRVDDARGALRPFQVVEEGTSEVRLGLSGRSLALPTGSWMVRSVDGGTAWPVEVGAGQESVLRWPPGPSPERCALVVNAVPQDDDIRAAMRKAPARFYVYPTRGDPVRARDGEAVTILAGPARVELVERWSDLDVTPRRMSLSDCPTTGARLDYALTSKRIPPPPTTEVSVTVANRPPGIADGDLELVGEGGVATAVTEGPRSLAPGTYTLRVAATARADVRNYYDVSRTYQVSGSQMTIDLAWIQPAYGMVEIEGVPESAERALAEQLPGRSMSKPFSDGRYYRARGRPGSVQVTAPLGWSGDPLTIEFVAGKTVTYGWPFIETPTAWSFRIASVDVVACDDLLTPRCEFTVQILEKGTTLNWCDGKSTGPGERVPTRCDSFGASSPDALEIRVWERDAFGATGAALSCTGQGKGNNHLFARCTKGKTTVEVTLTGSRNPSPG